MYLYAIKEADKYLETNLEQLLVAGQENELANQQFAQFLLQMDPALVDQKAGLLTIKDILAELEKPGRDPRPEFKTATLQDGVETIKDLKLGMVLEGTVTNVAAFGAFIDLGVHQDGLVHVSQLADKFVKDPNEVVKVSQKVMVRVTEVDEARKRIALSMKS